MNPFHRFLAGLDAELEALRLVRYRHQVCAVLLSAGDLRYLAIATDELTESENRLADCDLQRAFDADELAEFWDLDLDHPSLADLIERADEMEAALLADRRQALRAAVAEVEELRRVTRVLADGSLGKVSELCADLESSTQGERYDGVDDDLLPAVVNRRA